MKALPAHRNWKSVLAMAAKAVAGTAAVWLCATLSYAARGYVKEEVRSEALIATAQYALLPPKVQSLEEFRSRQEKSLETQEEKLEEIGRAVAVLQSSTDKRWAVQTEQDRRMIELLDHLDHQLKKATVAPPQQ